MPEVANRVAVVIESSLPSRFHQDTLIWLRCNQMTEDAPHESVPSGILADPRVIDAVRDMLGQDATADVCRHVHLNTGGEPGDWHVDDYCGSPWPAGQFALLCYFPQDTPVEMGPTAARVDGREIVASGPAGTCLLIRSDVEHRATANTSGRERYMLKYLFRQLDRDEVQPL